VFTLLNFEGGPQGAGCAIAGSPVAEHPQVAEALELLEERFSGPDHDGPLAYAGFLAEPGDEEEKARLCREAVATIREVFRGIRKTG
jgi:hypothetical protein